MPVGTSVLETILITELTHWGGGTELSKDDSLPGKGMFGTYRTPGIYRVPIMRQYRKSLRALSRFLGWPERSKLVLDG